MRIAGIITRSLVVIACLLYSFDNSLGADQKQIDQMIMVIERLCLSGSQYGLTADLSGNIDFKNLTAGSSGNVNVNIKRESGAVGYLREEIRSKVENHVRACMAPYIERLIAIILDQSGSSGGTISEGCTVTDPSGTPLNVRNAPNGPNILRTLPNGFRVKILSMTSSNGEPWGDVADSAGLRLGWVYRPYITCEEDRARSRPDAISGSCIVTDPTGTPLNVRTAPNGPNIIYALTNGYKVRILSIVISDGNTWVYITDDAGRRLGWVYRRYITC